MNRQDFRLVYWSYLYRREIFPHYFGLCLPFLLLAISGSHLIGWLGKPLYSFYLLRIENEGGWGFNHALLPSTVSGHKLQTKLTIAGDLAQVSRTRLFDNFVIVVVADVPSNGMVIFSIRSLLSARLWHCLRFNLANDHWGELLHQFDLLLLFFLCVSTFWL